MQKITKARFLEFWKNIFLGNILPPTLLLCVVENESNVKAFTISFWLMGSIIIYALGTSYTKESCNNFFRDNLKFIAWFWLGMVIIMVCMSILRYFTY